MKKIIQVYLLGVALFSFFVTPLALAQGVVESDIQQETASEEQSVVILPMKMMILPGTQAYLERGILKAAKDNAAVVVVVLDTPGGVLNTTQEMVQTIFKSPVPVVVYVAPSGAMAASAGTFITLAAHVAAMAPGTSMGAAHPVQGDGKDIGGDLRTKTENITVAMVKSIADQRGRNAEWAEKSIKDSSSITPTEALKLKVIDLIATDLDDLLLKIKGREVVVGGKKVILGDFSKLKRVTYSESFKERVLNSLGNPNILALLWFAATTGLALELYHPGAIFPGVVGIVCLFLALGVSQIIPVSSAGVLLIIVGGLLLGAEAYVTSGILGIGGVIAMVFGAIYLVDESMAPGIGVTPWFVIVLALLTTLLLVWVVYELLKVSGTKGQTGKEEMLGLKGRAATDFSPNGRVFVNGEYWNSVKSESSAEISKDDLIKVVGVQDGLVLKVEKI